MATASAGNRTPCLRVGFSDGIDGKTFGSRVGIPRLGNVIRGVMVAASVGAITGHCLLVYRPSCMCGRGSARDSLSGTTGTADGGSMSGKRAFAFRGLRGLGLSRFDVFPNKNTMCVDSVAVAYGGGWCGLRYGIDSGGGCVVFLRFAFGSFRE